MRKNLLYIILLLFLFASCNNKSTLIKELEKAYMVSDNYCLSDFITEDWDFVLITPESVSLEELNNLLGFPYPYFEDIALRIIFVKNNEIIYHEDYFPSYGSKTHKSIYFEIKNENENTYLKLHRDNSCFYVTKQDSIFILTHKS